MQRSRRSTAGQPAPSPRRAERRDQPQRAQRTRRRAWCASSNDPKPAGGVSRHLPVFGRSATRRSERSERLAKGGRRGGGPARRLQASACEQWQGLPPVSGNSRATACLRASRGPTTRSPRATSRGGRRRPARCPLVRPPPRSSFVIFVSFVFFVFETSVRRRSRRWTRAPGAGRRGRPGCGWRRRAWRGCCSRACGRSPR